MTRVVAVRHGETDWNSEGRMQGWAPVPLNETGRAQARSTGARLADEYDFDHALSSDLLRAEQTTEVLLEANGDLPVSFERAWRERGLGVYQGLSHADIESRFPEFSLNERGYRATERTPDGGESLRAVERRVVDRFEELADADAETVLVVTHGGPLCILLGHTKGMDLTESLSKHHLDNCAFAEFRVDGEETTVVSETLSVSD